MREMDLLLERFLASGYVHLDAAERRRFDELLDRPDQDIYAWIVGHEPAPNEAIERLVSTIRQCTMERA
jgi:antitoxin CptB